MRVRPLLRVLPLALLLAAACGRDSSERRPLSVSVRDSAGVSLVEHSGLSLHDASDWLDANSLVRIGRTEGDPMDLFGRVAGFARLRDGRVAVADAQASLIRVYNGDGTYSETIGGPGEGPGEFTYLQELHPYLGDSLLVVDYEGGRWTVLDPEGSFVRAWRPRVRGWTGRGTSPRLHGVFADGTFLLGEFRSGAGLTRDIAEGAVLQEDSTRFFRANESGEVLAELGTRVSGRWLTGQTPDGKPFTWDGMRPGVFWHVHGDHFYYADATRFEVRVFRSSGELETIIRVAAPPAAPPRVSADRLAEAQPVFRAIYAITPLPEQAPAFSELAVDAEGRVWILEYRNDYALERGSSGRWLVFEPDGTPLGVVRLPSELRTRRRPFGSGGARLIIGRDYVLSALYNDLGVETVGLLPLRRE